MASFIPCVCPSLNTLIPRSLVSVYTKNSDVVIFLRKAIPGRYAGDSPLAAPAPYAVPRRVFGVNLECFRREPGGRMRRIAIRVTLRNFRKVGREMHRWR
jgi:hypothetical protein